MQQPFPHGAGDVLLAGALALAALAHEPRLAPGTGSATLQQAEPGHGAAVGDKCPVRHAFGSLDRHALGLSAGSQSRLMLRAQPAPGR